MKNFTDSSFALNKYSEGIVYKFADGVVEVTLELYLSENPDKTEQDFLALKELSDEIYFEQDREENAQTKKNLSLTGLEDTRDVSVPSLDDYYISAIDAQEKERKRDELLITVANVLDKLTANQRRRYLMHYVEGLTVRKIAEIEGVSHVAVVYSIEAAEKKINKILNLT